MTSELLGRMEEISISPTRGKFADLICPPGKSMILFHKKETENNRLQWPDLVGTFRKVGPPARSDPRTSPLPPASGSGGPLPHPSGKSPPKSSSKCGNVIFSIILPIVNRTRITQVCGFRAQHCAKAPEKSIL